MTHYQANCAPVCHLRIPARLDTCSSSYIDGGRFCDTVCSLLLNLLAGGSIAVHRLKFEKERMMKKTLAMALATTALAIAGVTAATAADLQARYQEPDARNGVRIGYLTCDIDGGVGYVLGSAKEVDCVFRSTVGSERSDHYTGAIKKLGVDLGFTTRSRLVWAVFAPTAGYHQGSLSGVYRGATAEATLGAGIGTNVLFGGTAGSVHLQAISVTGQIGLNIAATGTSMTLASAN
jgi:hypothetical protein